MTSISSKAKNWVITTLVCVYLIAAIAFVIYTHLSNRYPKVELIEPVYLSGVRIPGTNYMIEKGDTLLIKADKCYSLQILTKEEKKQARAYINRLHK